MRIQNPRSLDRELLINFLVKGICQVSFIKVKDGTNRAIYCTLNYSFIPKQFEQSLEKVIKDQPADPDIMPIWDVVDGKWKSFRISKLNFFINSDELESENKSGHAVNSNFSELLKKRREDAIAKFENTVEDLKEKAKEAKKNINGKNTKERTKENLDKARDIINKLRSDAENRRRSTE